MTEQVAKARVRLPRRAHPCVLAHGPKTAAVHGGVNPSGERWLARPSQIALGVESVQIAWLVERPDLDARVRHPALSVLFLRHGSKGTCSMSDSNRLIAWLPPGPGEPARPHARGRSKTGR